MVNQWWADGGDYAFRFDYDLTEGSTVLDLGGYEGQWASDLFARYRCHIFVFEPVSCFAERISLRFRKNNKIKVFQFGLGSHTRSEPLYISDDSSSAFCVSEVVEQIRIVDVKDWFEEMKLDNIDLIKINTEGNEYELLDRLIETQLIDKFLNIQVQFHNISDVSRIHMDKIRSELAKTHKPTYQYEFVWENWERESGTA